MTTSTLNAYESDYAVGRQHVHFDGRSSTPTTGAMNDRDAQCYWRVVNEAGDAFVHRVNGVLDFAWLGTGTQSVRMMAVDRAGNKGSWVTYTYSVAANAAADHVRYVDNTASGGAAGTEGDPFETIAEAKSYMASNVGSGEVGIIFVREGQTHSLTASAWDGGDATARLVRFVRWGTSTTKPVMQWNASSTGFNFGKRGSIHVESIVLNGGTTPHAATCVNSGRSTGDETDRNAYNGMFYDVDFESWGYTFEGEDDLAAAERYSGVLDFMAWEDCTFSGNEHTGGNHYYWIGLRHLRYGLMRNVEILDGVSGQQVFRLYSWADSVIDGFVDDSDTSVRLRFASNPTSEPLGWERCSFSGITRYTTSAEFADISLEADASIDGNAAFTDCRWVNCTLTGGGYATFTDNGGADNGVECTRVDFINCVASRQFTLGVSAVSANVHTSVRFRDCTVVRGYQDGAFLILQGSSTSYAADAIEVHGCYIYWRQTESLDYGGFYVAGGISQAELADIIGASDYNHTAKVDGDSVNWLEHSGGTSSRSAWTTASGFDGNSDHLSSTTLDLTDNGATNQEDLDVRLTAGSGPLAGAGYPLPSGVAIDADGFLRDTSTPDAGPFEFGASATPDDPSLSGSPYTLTADAGAFTLTGQDASPLVDRVVTADAAAFTMTGQDASLLVGYAVAADAGAFTASGQDADFLRGYVLAAEAGAFVLTGQDATLTIPGSYTLTAEAGSFAITGQDASFLRGYIFTVDPGALVLTGQNASFRYSGNVQEIKSITIAISLHLGL